MLEANTMKMIRRSVFLGGVLLGAVGCNDLTKDPGLPAGTPDPATYNTAAGAVGLRNAAFLYLNAALPTYVMDAGLLSDEFQDPLTGAGQGVILQNGGQLQDPLDERILPEGVSGSASGYNGSGSYAGLQNVRAGANVALGALAKYDTAPGQQTTQHTLRGELFAVQGYAEILLADLFCSGVPLSTLDFGRDFTYAPSSSTTQVYQDALHKLDSALALAPAGDSVQNMAQVLKGRALLALGQYVDAAAAVAGVPVTFQYRTTVQFTADGSALQFRGGISDREGNNGLPYVSDGDSRTATTMVCTPPNTSCSGTALRFPAKYQASGYTSFVVANGIEARLIEAEAQLQPARAPSGPWLATLNQLRESAGLADTTDPGIGAPDATTAAAARIALLFRERAFWLFATGHRQGDLRRLLRQYGQYTPFQSQQQVYPSGIYSAPGTGLYGSDVNAPIPTTEYANSNYHGCLDRNP